MTDPAVERDAALAEVATLKIEVARARIELIAMRQRAYDLAVQLEQVSSQRDRQCARPAPKLPPLATERRWGLARVVRAARRPRRTLRILLGRSPD